MKNAMHSAATPEHGTPGEYVDLARQVLRVIDIDPATSAEWNTLVGARRILTREDNALRTPWLDGWPRADELLTDERESGIPPTFGATVFCNPPGSKDGSLVARFWLALSEYYRRGFVSSAIWIGFSLEQVSRLQRVGARSHPLQHTTLIPSRRIAYRATPTTIGEDPTHASYVTLLSDDQSKVQLFAALGVELGHVITGGILRR